MKIVFWTKLFEKIKHKIMQASRSYRKKWLNILKLSFADSFKIHYFNKMASLQ